MAARRRVPLGPEQAATYAAEEATVARCGREWSSVREAQAYLDGLVSSAWFFERWPDFVRATIERRGSGATWSTCHGLDAGGPGGRPTEGVILLAGPVFAQATLLHELAHLLAPPGAGHGAPFTDTLLELIRNEMGFFAFSDLRHALS
jgi:hypothetical protein